MDCKSSILLILLIGAYASTAIATTTIGVEVSPDVNTNRVVEGCRELGITMVHIHKPTPAFVSSFCGSGLIVMISVQNSYIKSFLNLVSVQNWVTIYVEPFFHCMNISMITLGEDVNVDMGMELEFLADSLRNLKHSLSMIGAAEISISTVFSFENIVVNQFPPSKAVFNPSILDFVLYQVLEFLEDNNSTLMINVSPFKIFLENPLLPLGYAVTVIGNSSFDLKLDPFTDEKYHSLFQEIIRSTLYALEASGFPNVQLGIATGWPTSGIWRNYSGDFYSDLLAYATPSYVSTYKKPAFMVIHELFDHSSIAGGTTVSAGQGPQFEEFTAELEWGILDKNLSFKIKWKSIGAHAGNIGMGILEILSYVSLGFMFSLIIFSLLSGNTIFW